MAYINSFAITGRERLWPGLAQITAGQAQAKGVDRYGDTYPNIWTGGHYCECPPIIWGVKSSQVVSVCSFHGILFHQNTFYLNVVKEASVPLPNCRFCPWIPQGDFRPPDSVLFPPYGDRSTPIVIIIHYYANKGTKITLKHTYHIQNTILCSMAQAIEQVGPTLLQTVQGLFSENSL